MQQKIRQQKTKIKGVFFGWLSFRSGQCDLTSSESCVCVFVKSRRRLRLRRSTVPDAVTTSTYVGRSCTERIAAPKSRVNWATVLALRYVLWTVSCVKFCQFLLLELMVRMHRGELEVSRIT